MSTPPELGPIRFPSPVAGFSSTEYTLTALPEDDGSVVFWQLAAVAGPDAGVTWLCVDPWSVRADYELNLSAADQAVVGDDVDTLLTVAIVKVAETGATVNLLAPVVVNVTTLVGAQVLLSGSGWKIAEPVTGGEDS